MSIYTKVYYKPLKQNKMNKLIKEMANKKAREIAELLNVDIDYAFEKLFR